jgi:hypothetical protein
MKRLILISAFFTVASSCFAQSTCGSSNPIFKSDKYGEPKDVYNLGSSPEFPFLRNLKTPEQVAAAMNKAAKKKNAAELNKILMDMGFANGAKDITASSISAVEVPTGTVGNMGDGNHNISFIKLNVGDENKAWKVSSPSGCSMLVLAKCGNSFYPTPKQTAKLDVPVNLNNTTKEVTLENAATKTTTTSTYVYYTKKKDRKRDLAPEYSGLTSTKASTPVLLSTTKKVETVPQTYRVTVNSAQNNVTVVEDQPLELTTNINVEKTSEYTGNYPTKVNKEYREVSKGVYRRCERKMHKALQKEEKIAELAGVPVTTNVKVPTNR